MPAPALPEAWPTPLPGTVTLRREYRDPLGRPMRGKVTLTGSERHDGDGLTVLPVAVTVDLNGGVLEVALPPDTYTLTAALRTTDGERVSDSSTVVLQ